MTHFTKTLLALLFVIVLGNASLPTIQTVSTSKIEMVAGGGSGPLGGSVKGTHLDEPFGVAFDKSGNWYICEYIRTPHHQS
ncbi:MAG: hypothetical protein M3458_23665 [Acidobacteriota bacterium]|nr:hypothetical protein [Acidobacteriota bacterium]